MRYKTQEILSREMRANVKKGGAACIEGKTNPEWPLRLGVDVRDRMKMTNRREWYVLREESFLGRG